MHPNTIKTAHNLAQNNVWYAHKQSLHTHSCSKNTKKKKTNQCLMLQILGVREEGSGRIEAERESRERMGGVIKRVITGGDTVILWLSICYGCNSQECTGGEARNLGMSGPQPRNMLPRGCCLSKKGAWFFSVMDAGCRKNNRQVSKQMLHSCFTSLSSL